MRQQLAGLIGLALFILSNYAWFGVLQRRQLFSIGPEVALPRTRVPLLPLIIAAAYVGLSLALISPNNERVTEQPAGQAIEQPGEQPDEPIRKPAEQPAEQPDEQPDEQNDTANESAVETGVEVDQVRPTKSSAEVSQKKVSPSQLANVLITSLLIWAGLLAVLGLSAHGLDTQGISLRNSLGQAKLGLDGYFLAIIPSFIAMAALSAMSVRTQETQNPLLRELQETTDPSMWLLVAVTAIVLAPLMEELIFRVILQGGLSDYFGERWGIAISAILFASAHGFADALALMPLAILLGILRAQSGSYVAVVVVHALFNGTMLSLMALVVEESPIGL